jgi:hypothetical protein
VGHCNVLPIVKLNHLYHLFYLLTIRNELKGSFKFVLALVTNRGLESHHCLPDRDKNPEYRKGLIGL